MIFSVYRYCKYLKTYRIYTQIRIKMNAHTYSSRTCESNSSTWKVLMNWMEKQTTGSMSPPWDGCGAAFRNNADLRWPLSLCWHCLPCSHLCHSTDILQIPQAGTRFHGHVQPQSPPRPAAHEEVFHALNSLLTNLVCPNTTGPWLFPLQLQLKQLF